jgi:isoleucyl-tRNA synthetase
MWALAINPNITYIAITLKSNYEQYIIAQDLVENLFPDPDSYIISSVLDGKKILFDKNNKPRFVGYDFLYEMNNTNKKAYYLIPGDFVTTQDGTGIVHIAPAFGEDDARVGQENNLPTLLTVDAEGKISADVPGKGIPVKKKNAQNKYAVDELIIEDLKKRGLLFKEELYEHDYPFCWRCDTPLIYYAKPSWFVRMSAFRDLLTKNNESINWTPAYIKEGRFGEWLKDAKDWAISRDRYWGTPLPIWKCKECGKIKVIESSSELEKLSGNKIEDLHKPFIDEVTFKCECGEEMRRESEVMDVWFDSGSMPTAQFHYPNNATKEDAEKIESGKFYPADYISEAIDQTRGWFYTLHAISTLLNQAGKVPTGNAYKNVICLGLILDEKGKKMSKSKGNIVDPMEVMDKYGADMFRWMLYTINQPGLPKKFDIKKMNEIMNRVFRMLWNSYSFFVMYANIDKFSPSSQRSVKPSNNLLDKWILSELNILIKNVDEKLNGYDIYTAGNLIEKFIDNLSNWYIRRSRKRFWKSESDTDKNSAYQTLYIVLAELSKLMAPFTPFISEEIYKNLTENESVHLKDFPKANESLIDEELNEEMNLVRNIVSEGLQLRAQAKIKVRQPLSVLSIKHKVSSEDLINIIKDEVNVKEVVVNDKIEAIELNTEITEELKLEGQAREIIRHIQEMRKEAGYEVDNRIVVGYNGMQAVFEKFGDLIAKETLANNISEKEVEDADLVKGFKIDNEEIAISIKKRLGGSI